MEETFCDQPIKKRTDDNIQKMQLVRVMITQLGVYQVIHILRNITSYLE